MGMLCRTTKHSMALLGWENTPSWLQLTHTSNCNRGAKESPPVMESTPAPPQKATNEVRMRSSLMCGLLRAGELQAAACGAKPGRCCCRTHPLS